MAEYHKASDIKKSYYETLLSENKTERAEEIKIANEYDAIYKYNSLHPEEVSSSKKLNQALYETGLDIISLDNEIALLAQDYDALFTECENRILLIDQNIKTEQNRLEDYNLITGKYGFDYHIALNAENFQGNFDYHNDGYFSAFSSSAKQVELAINKVSGKGYEGNKYAYRNGEFLIDIDDTSNYQYPFDGKKNTYFEYSRIKTSNKELAEEDIYFDEEDCKCSIIITSKNGIELFNTIQIATELSALKLTKVEVSYDEGKTFTVYNDTEITISDMKTKYSSSTDYYYSVITFPETNIVRLSFSSNIHFIEELARKINEEKIESIKDSVRYAILLNEITAYNSKYVESSMVSDTFAIENAHDIGIYVNEKIYGSADIGDNIQYYLNINGTDYKIAPLNSERNRIQLIKTSDFEYYNPKVQLITDKISSAYLTVIFKTEAESQTAFCKDIKICVRY